MDWEVLNTAATWLACSAGAFTIAFSLVSLAAALIFFRFSGRGKAASVLPPVSIMKPLKGEDRGLFENLESFCAQDYPVFQVIFCAADPEDPALRVVERLRKKFPKLDIETVVSPNAIGCNPKVSNLANAYSKVKHGLLLISDSDIRVGPDFLRKAVAPLEDPKIGLVNCFYRMVPGRPRAGGSGLWSQLEALSINAHFLPQAVAAAAFGMRFAMGAAILVRRSVFDKTGGFKNLADHIADDYTLGASVQAAGYGIEFPGVVIDSVTEISGPAELFRHQIREARTIRICQPAGYCGTILLHGFSLLTLKMAVFGADPVSAGLWLSVIAARISTTYLIHRVCLNNDQSLRSLLLIPLSEWLSTATWLGGFGSNQVLWRGNFYSIESNGHLTPV